MLHLCWILKDRNEHQAELRGENETLIIPGQLGVAQLDMNTGHVLAGGGHFWLI